MDGGGEMTTALEPRTMMRFRQADVDDVPRLVDMLRQFVTSTKYRKFIGESPEALQTFLLGLLANPDAAVFVAHRDEVVIGMIGVLGYVHPMSGERCAGELFWWLDPDDRGAGGWLLRRAEKWATAYGATNLQMIAPSDNPRVAAMYEKLGYEEVERAFHKRLT
jgi:RimJ/RimL family protein N-acetyltransferase